MYRSCGSGLKIDVLNPAVLAICNMDMILTNYEIFLRLLSALALGVLLGMERNFVHKTAGMRTYGLVALGAALFTLVPILAMETYLALTGFDPLRIASQIVVGVGFLGAGLMFREREGDVANVTTAAGIWVAAGVGMAAGMGFYVLAALAAALTLVTFTLLVYFEEKVKKAAEKFGDGRDNLK